MATYISGSTKDLHKGKAQFDNAESDLIATGRSPVNPLKLLKSLNISFRLEALSRCDSIYLLPGWQESNEARTEKFWAEIYGKEILFQSQEEAKKYRGAAIESHVNRITGAIHEVTGMKLQDYSSGPRSINEYYCRVLFSFHCNKAGLEPDDIAGHYIDRSRTAIIHCLNKYPDELVNPKFRALADKVNAFLYPETYHTDTVKA